MLNRNIEYPSDRQVLWAIFFISIVACGILLFFQPFGVNNYDPTESITFTLVLAVFSMGVVMAVIFTFNEFVIRPRLIRTYSIGKVVLWLFWSLLLGGAATYLQYNLLGGWHDWSIGSYADFSKNWAILTMIPLAIVVLYFRQQSLKQELQETALNSEDRTQLFIFTGENQKDRIALPVDDIIYIESQDNYVDLSYTSGQRIRRHLLRSTLQRMEEELADTAVMRCHRSYLVNLDNVTSFKGNSHRLELTLKGLDSTIPVSRNYTGKVLSRLKGITQ